MASPPTFATDQKKASISTGTTSTSTAAAATATKKVEHNYRDHAHLTEREICGGDGHAILRGATVTAAAGNNNHNKITNAGERHFPVKLHFMLQEIEQDGLGHIVSWQPHGRAFVVHKQAEFVEKILPMWFRQSKFASFQRQLNLYGFKRLTTGRDKNGYYHELFLRGKRFLAHQIPRCKLKGQGARKPTSPESEPNFYLYPCLPSESAVSQQRAVGVTAAQPLASDFPLSVPSAATTDPRIAQAFLNGRLTLEHLVHSGGTGEFLAAQNNLQYVAAANGLLLHPPAALAANRAYLAAQRAYQTALTALPSLHLMQAAVYNDSSCNSISHLPMSSSDVALRLALMREYSSVGAGLLPNQFPCALSLQQQQRQRQQQQNAGHSPRDKYSHHSPV